MFPAGLQIDEQGAGCLAASSVQRVVPVSRNLCSVFGLPDVVNGPFWRPMMKWKAARAFLPELRREH